MFAWQQLIYLFIFTPEQGGGLVLGRVRGVQCVAFACFNQPDGPYQGWVFDQFRPIFVLQRVKVPSEREEVLLIRFCGVTGVVGELRF